MKIIDFDKIELQFEEYSIILPKHVIEKLEIDKKDQLIEKKYEPEDVYIVINRILAEEIWKEGLLKNLKRNNKRHRHIIRKRQNAI